MSQRPSDRDYRELCQRMRQALELARQSWGQVEPNPMVGCLLVKDGRVVGQGRHRRFGGPHAEVEALEQSGAEAAGATCVVTLEPCCHRGKTAPCTEALIRAGVSRVVIGCLDPNPQVHGRGVDRLRAAGLDVTVGVLEDECLRLVAPFAKLIQTGRPWVIAKWAMTLDGHLASRTGDSKWISSPESRERVHRLRGGVDAIVVGIETVLADDCRLTARPPGPRTATRVVLDRRARLPLESRLVRTAHDVPVLVAVGPEAEPERIGALEAAGCRIWKSTSADRLEFWEGLQREMGRREWTQILVEGGARVLGTCFDTQSVDEVHVFVSPKIIGGEQAPSAVGGVGVAGICEAFELVQPQFTALSGDIYLSGRIDRSKHREPEDIHRESI